MEPLFERFMMAVIMTFGACAALLAVILTLNVAYTCFLRFSM